VRTYFKSCAVVCYMSSATCRLPMTSESFLYAGTRQLTRRTARRYKRQPWEWHFSDNVFSAYVASVSTTRTLSMFEHGSLRKQHSLAGTAIVLKQRHIRWRQNHINSMAPKASRQKENNDAQMIDHCNRHAEHWCENNSAIHWLTPSWHSVLNLWTHFQIC
jgi:hypothetical protein